MAHSSAYQRAYVDTQVDNNIAPAAARDTSPWFFLMFGPTTMLITVILVAWLSKASL
jgi:hypothetical protein